MNSIKTADGTVHSVDSAGVYGGILSFTLNNNSGSVRDIANIFSNPTANAEIIYSVDEPVETFSGYTELVTVMDRRWVDGSVMVQLKKGE